MPHTSIPAPMLAGVAGARTRMESMVNRWRQMLKAVFVSKGWEYHMEEIAQSQCHVLLLEDNSMIRRSIRNQLTKHGYTVHDTADAGQAKQWLEEFKKEYKEKFAGIITDIDVHNGTGFDLHDHVMTHLPAEEHPHFSTLFMTSDSDNHAEIARRVMELDPRTNFVSKMGGADPFGDIVKAFNELRDQNHSTLKN